MRKSGILLPIASLPSRYGIGAFSKDAYHFIDQLKAAGQKYWQILPLGPTGYGDSPYQSFSTFAGNPYFIDLETLIADGHLTKEECEAFDFGKDARNIDYEKIYLSRFKALEIAYKRSHIDKDKRFQQFSNDNSYWLDDYALYMAVKNHFSGRSWTEWDNDIRMREASAVQRFKGQYEDEITFYKYQQFLFNDQWMKLKDYANRSGIKIIGDIPIYVAFDSADSWSHPELFQFNEDRKPIAVAGCPPDSFSPTGQLWGSPLYDWKYHKDTSYAWWIQRIGYAFKLYDSVRVDHFRGFDAYYSIPGGAATAEVGEWKKGPGYDIFMEIKKQLGDLSIFVEDLGFLTESVFELVRKTGYPGMKILQFAFDSREENDYLPYNYSRNCVVYTGTHDNDTIPGWYKSLNPRDKQLVMDYLDIDKNSEKDVHWKLIRLALSSVADTVIIPLQDYLGLGSGARINKPSTLGGNWVWRLLEGEVTDDLVQEIRRITKLYGR